MEKTEETTVRHGEYIRYGEYKKSTHIKYYDEEEFWHNAQAALSSKKGEDETILNIEELTIYWSEWVNWREHPNYIKYVGEEE